MPTPNVFTPGGACLPASSDTFGGRGYLGTAGGGFDYQLGGLGLGAWNPMIVVGLMADYNFESLKGTMDDRRRRRQRRSKKPPPGPAAPALAWPSDRISSPTSMAARPAPASAARASSRTSPARRSALTTAAFWKTGWFLGGGTETSLSADVCRSAGSCAANIATPTSTRRMFRPHCWRVSPAATIGFHPVVQTLSTSLIYKFNWQ